MAQRGANVLAALEKFKKKQKEAGKTLVRIAEERDAKRAKLASGKGQPPLMLPDADAVKKAVTTDAKAVGYMDKAQVDGSVKVILTLD